MDERTREFIQRHRVAHLATADRDAKPSVIPVCYAFDGEHIYSPIDEKPKKVHARRLARVRNVKSNPRVALVIDDYSEDWNELAYVLIRGMATILEPGESPQEHRHAVDMLRDKYTQYRDMAIEKRPIIRITPGRIKAWRGAGLQGD